MSDSYNTSPSPTAESTSAFSGSPKDAQVDDPELGLGRIEAPSAVPSQDVSSQEISEAVDVADVDVADGVYRRLHPAWITTSRIRGLISSAVLIGLLGVAWITAGFVLGHWWIASIVWVALALLLLARAVFWPRLAWRYYAYAVSSRGLRIRRGVLSRSIVSVPKTRIQHTDVSQGPFQRHFGIATLTVHTAGTQYAAVSLPGVPHATALAIRNFLIDDEAGDGV